MNRADQGNPTQDLDKGRGWLERAEAALEAWEASVSPTSPDLLQRPEFAQAAAAIGRGFVALAEVESRGPVPTLIHSFGDSTTAAAFRRGVRAAEEARPHDGELPAAEPAPPCGHPDDACGLRGGSAHCGGCND